MPVTTLEVSSSVARDASARPWTEASSGPTWAQRASLHPLSAVVSPFRPPAENWAIHLIESAGLLRWIDWGRRFRRTIDFGCGTGRFLSFLKRCSDEVWGLDVTPEMLECSRRAVGHQPGIHLRPCDGDRLPADLLLVDQIFCSAVLRTIRENSEERFESLVSDWFKGLQPGGRVVIMEMYLDAPLDAYLAPFARAGFVVERGVAIHHYGSRAVRWIAACRQVPVLPRLIASLEVRRAFRRTRLAQADYVIELSKPSSAS